MKLTKRQIARIKAQHNKTSKAMAKALGDAEVLATIISEYTGVEGEIDFLAGDGFGFTPNSSNDTHVSIDFIIKEALSGKDITEKLILDNLSF